MSARRALGLLAAAWTLSACTPRPPNLRPYVAPSPPSAAQTIIDVSRARGLPLEAPIETATLGDDDFLRAYHGPAKKGPKRIDAFWSAFTMAGASMDMDAVARKMLDDNIRGFYDPATKRLYVRKSTKADPSGTDRLTMAHEAEHALQDRFFGIPDLTSGMDADEALAVRALFEGDATVASVVLDANRQGSASAETLAQLARNAEKDDVQVLRASGILTPPNTPPLLRAELAWPYLRGSELVAELATSGGWALVNDALRNPPKTTEQVLHIEKYLAGEGAIDVRAPEAPEGYALLERGRMGELRTRFLLAQCSGDQASAAAARGWGGDAYAIVSRGDERALLWSTAWDDEGAAARFAGALEGRRACTRSGEKPPFTVVRQGTRVAFVQGMSDEPTRNVAGAQLITLVGKTPPPVPPVGNVRLRAKPPIQADFAHGATFSQGRFVDASNGLEGSLEDLVPRANDDLDLFAVGEFVSVGVGVVWAPPSDALSETAMAGFVAAFRGAQPGLGQAIFDAGASRVRLSWTMATARSVRIGDRIDLRFVFAPTCGGRMTVVLVTAAQPGTFGGDTAASWLESIKATDSSPACEALRSLRDPAEERAAP